MGKKTRTPSSRDEAPMKKERERANEESRKAGKTETETTTTKKKKKKKKKQKRKKKRSARALWVAGWRQRAGRQMRRKSGANDL